MLIPQIHETIKIEICELMAYVKIAQQDINGAMIQPHVCKFLNLARLDVKGLTKLLALTIMDHNMNQLLAL